MLQKGSHNSCFYRPRLCSRWTPQVLPLFLPPFPVPMPVGGPPSAARFFSSNPICHKILQPTDIPLCMCNSCCMRAPTPAVAALCAAALQDRCDWRQLSLDEAAAVLQVELAQQRIGRSLLQLNPLQLLAGSHQTVMSLHMTCTSQKAHRDKQGCASLRKASVPPIPKRGTTAKLVRRNHNQH